MLQLLEDQVVRMTTDINILIVDDVRMVQRTMSQLLVRYCGASPMRIHTELTGAAMLSTYKKIKPELVLLDIMLKSENGIDLLKILLEMDPDAHVVMCTASNELKDVKRAIEAGAKGYILKPPGSKELSKVVGELVKIHPEKFHLVELQEIEQREQTEQTEAGQPAEGDGADQVATTAIEPDEEATLQAPDANGAQTLTNGTGC